MKKIVIVLVAMVAALTFASCQKIETPAPEEETPVSENKEIRFEIKVADPMAETRVAKTKWETGDKLYLWFNGYYGHTPDLTLTFDGTKWNGGTLRDGCTLPEGGTFYAVYGGRNDIDSYCKVTYNNTSSSFRLWPTANANIYVDNDSYKRVYESDLFLSTAAINYIIEKGVFKATIENWTLLTSFQVTITGVPEGEYALNCTSVIPNFSTYTCAQPIAGIKILEDGFVIDGTDWRYYASAISSSQNEVVFYFHKNYPYLVSPSSFTFTLIPKKDGVYQSANALTYVTGSKDCTASYQAVTMPFNKFKTIINGHEYVDMGAAGKWATMNVGANSETDYGNYYAWGETVPKEDYSESEYSVTPETFADVAANWGSGWRMPTKADWDNLLNADICTSSWETNYKDSGMNGRLFTCTSNGNTLFLPAAGYRKGVNLLTAGSEGYYCSSSLYENSTSSAWDLYFYSNISISTNLNYRYYGRSVRPVVAE